MKTTETQELEKLLGIVDTEEQEIIRINTYEDAEGAMGVYSAAQYRILERTTFVRERVEMVMNRLDQLNAEDEKRKVSATEVLREWGDGFVKKTKVKTIKLIHGQMSFKDVPEAVVVDDADKVSREILVKREDKDFTEKYGTVPLKIEIKFKEPGDPESTARIREAVDELANTIQDSKVKVDVGQREILDFYKRTGFIFDGSHVRPKLENASFKIEAANLGGISAPSQSKVDSR